MIHIQLSGHNVDKTSEIVTLLHYLRENLIYGQGVYHMEPRGKTGLHGVKSWHVTAQEHVTGAMLFRSVDAESAAMLDTRVDVQKHEL